MVSGAADGRARGGAPPSEPTGTTPGPRAAPVQLALPFLTATEAGTIHAAREAVARSEALAVARRHPAEAAELARLGDELVAILERNAAAARACQPASTGRGGDPDRPTIRGR